MTESNEAANTEEAEQAPQSDYSTYDVDQEHAADDFYLTYNHPTKGRVTIDSFPHTAEDGQEEAFLSRHPHLTASDS